MRPNKNVPEGSNGHVHINLMENKNSPSRGSCSYIWEVVTCQSKLSVSQLFYPHSDNI